MRVIVVVAQGCVSKVRTKSFNSIPHRYRRYHTGVRELRETRITGVRLRATASGSGTLIELEWFVAVILYRDFYHEGSTTSHRGGAHVEMRELFSLNRQTVSTQPSTENAHVPQPTTYRYTEYLYEVWYGSQPFIQYRTYWSYRTGGGV